MLEVFGPDFRLRLPMRPASRSVNLGNSVGGGVGCLPAKPYLGYTLDASGRAL
jgi:hypothetical protein